VSAETDHHDDSVEAASELSAEQLAAHDQAMARDEDGYLDPITGYFVMTRGYHLRRGDCCGNRCRHCPYGHINCD